MPTPEEFNFNMPSSQPAQTNTQSNNTQQENDGFEFKTPSEIQTEPAQTSNVAEPIENVANPLYGVGAGVASGLASNYLAPAKPVVGSVSPSQMANKIDKIAQLNQRLSDADWKSASGDHEIPYGTGTVSDVIDNHDLATKRHEAAFNSLQEAKENAKSLNLVPEEHLPAEKTQLLEQKKLAAKLGIPIDEGAMRHNIKSGNIVDYNAVRKGMTGTTEATEGLGRLSGEKQVGRLIVSPNAGKDLSIYSPDQQKAIQDLNKAHVQHEEAKVHLKRAKSEMDKATSTRTKYLNEANRAWEKALDQKRELEAGLEELKKLPVVSPLAKLGRAIDPFVAPVGGALSGMDLINAVNEYKKQNYKRATLDLIGGLGGLASLAPHPVVKGVGMGMSMIPPAVDYFFPEEEKQ
jgi:hypothetical protein